MIKKWWILFLAMLIGGLIGTGLSFLRAPRFEAEAKISTGYTWRTPRDIQSLRIPLL